MIPMTTATIHGSPERLRARVIERVRQGKETHARAIALLMAIDPERFRNDPMLAGLFLAAQLSFEE